MNKKGFTLIELLVVIAIIGLLSSLAIISLNNARQKAYDTQVTSDLNQIRTAAEIFYGDNGTYTGFGADASFTKFDPPTCSDESGDYSISIATDGESYIAWGDLCASASADFCIDSTGAAKEVASLAGTETACP